MVRKRVCLVFSKSHSKPVTRGMSGFYSTPVAGEAQREGSRAAREGDKGGQVNKEEGRVARAF